MNVGGTQHAAANFGCRSSPFERLRLRREQARARTPSRTRPTHSARTAAQARRGGGRRAGVDHPSSLVALRANRPQLRPHDAAPGRRGATRSRSSTTSAAARPRGTSRPLPAVVELPFGVYVAAAGLRGPTSPKRSSRRAGLDTGCAGSEPPSSTARRRRARRTRCCARGRRRRSFHRGATGSVSAWRVCVTSSLPPVMRVLVTGGAGIHRLSLRQSAPRRWGRGRRRARQAHLLGQPRGPGGVGTIPRGRHRRSRAVARSGARLRRDRQLRRRDACRPLDSRRDRVRPHRVLRDAGAARARAPERRSLRQVSTDGVYGDLELGGGRADRSTRPSSPYSVAKAAGDLQIPAYVQTYGVNASIRAAQTYGRTSTREAGAALRHERSREAARSTATGARSATGCTSRITARASSSCSARALREAYNVGGGGDGSTSTSLTRSSGCSAPTCRCSATSRIAPATTGATASTARAARPRLVARGRLRGRPEPDRRVVSRAPRLVGADQVRGVP